MDTFLVDIQLRRRGKPFPASRPCTFERFVACANKWAVIDSVDGWGWWKAAAAPPVKVDVGNIWWACWCWCPPYWYCAWVPPKCPAELDWYPGIWWVDNCCCCWYCCCWWPWECLPDLTVLCKWDMLVVVVGMLIEPTTWASEAADEPFTFLVFLGVSLPVCVRVWLVNARASRNPFRQNVHRYGLWTSRDESYT